jgi:hypothetical protein
VTAFAAAIFAVAALNLREAMGSLGLGPNQQAELAAEPDRAIGWIEWAARQRLTNPAATVISRFRTGLEAPDPELWRGDTGTERTAKAAPDYVALLRACETIVDSCGHEYREEDLVEEFEAAGRRPQLGNGAVLTDVDRQRLLRNASVRRERWDREEAERLGRECTVAVGYYLRQVREGKLSAGYVAKTVVPRMRGQGLAAGDVLAGDLARLEAAAIAAEGEPA